MRPTLLLITVAVLVATPVAVVTAEALAFCEEHDLGPRLSQHQGCAEQPCCLSSATPASSRDHARLKKAPPTPGAAVVAVRGHTGPPTAILHGPPGSDRNPLQVRSTTVLRC